MMSESVTDSELVFVLLQGLPGSYKGIREALEMQDALTVDGVSDKLRDVPPLCSGFLFRLPWLAAG